MRVVVAGAGTLGRRVTRYVSDKHTVTVIEKAEARARAVAAEYAASELVTVLHGDADEPSVLLEAGVDRADVFVAATGHDEDNLVACLLAKNEYKVKKVIAAVRNPRNRWLYNRSWGVDVALDSAQIVARLIEEEATLADLVTLLDLKEGAVTITSVTATDGGSLAGKRFDELKIPPRCYPAAILRGNDVLMPGPELRIEVGDMLLVIAGPGGECLIDELG
jgi:trk system potassium uptake protein TrkA